MNIIITMAGNSKRFKDAGFQNPKYELIVKEKPMFQWALSSLKDFFEKENFIFVSKKGSERYIKAQCELLGIINFQVIEIDNFTRGQASTALIATETLPKLSPIMIYNIDTYINGGLRFEIPKKCDGWIPVFSAQGYQWSFVKMDKDNIVTKIAEKERISEWGTIGLYFFSSAQLFKQCFDATYAAPNMQGETYIAPIYQHIIDTGGYIMAEVINSSKVIPLGTPLEVMQFDNQFFEVNKDGR